MPDNHPSCATCPFAIADRTCRTAAGRHPANCPTALEPDVTEAVSRTYHSAETYHFARQASLQEKDGYQNRELGYAQVRPAKPRIEEIFDFIARMGYRRIGMAFCMGLQREAAIVAKLFAARDLELVSAICKVGRVPKEELGLTGEERIAMACRKRCATRCCRPNC